MKSNMAQDIKRLKGGSIDYGYYATTGHMARHEEIKSFLGRVVRLAPEAGPIIPVIGMIIVLPFLI